jgi:CBS domain-containing protein
MTAGRICSRVVATAAPSERVRIAARRMATNDVGTLVVLDDAGRGEAVGIVTDRDIALRCVAGELNPDEAHVSEVMTHPVETIDEYASVDTALAKMASGGKRRLIVTGDDHRVVGIVSLDDVLGMLAREIRPIGRLLEQQEPRIPA